MTPPPGHLETISAENRAVWRAWLESHHATFPGVVLVYFKKGSGKPSVTYPEAVKEALCFGWIDSTRYVLDATRFSQVFTPRKPKSVWSRLNKTYIEELTSQGLITPAGLAKIELARQNGSWAALEEGESLQVPEDLSAALSANPAANTFFAAFPPSTRKYILHWIGGARQDETRRRRIQETVNLAARNIRVRGRNLKG